MNDRRNHVSHDGSHVCSLVLSSLVLSCLVLSCLVLSCLFSFIFPSLSFCVSVLYVLVLLCVVCVWVLVWVCVVVCVWCVLCVVFVEVARSPKFRSEELELNSFIRFCE